MVLKDDVLRLSDVPLVIRLAGMPQVARGTPVRLDIVRWDEVDLEGELVQGDRHPYFRVTGLKNHGQFQ